LENLTPDKIVCLVNMILGGITLSSLGPLMSILFSDSIIKRIKKKKKFLDIFPLISALLQIKKPKNTIKKELAIVYFILHLVTIIGSILCNIYMLCL
jgi:hypothetical protein